LSKKALLKKLDLIHGLILPGGATYLKEYYKDKKRLS
jgi:hypothetical protein